jgi:murein DD-endopeptidase MepM/ murein hydrolase activator NlpD
MVLMRMDDGKYTLFAHLSKVLVRPGQRVSTGKLIAYSGNTGNSTGPHLHFEVRQDGRPHDPLNYYR